MNLRRYGDRALLLEVGSTRDVVAWSGAVREAGIEGLVDVVSGAETVLVVLEGPERVDEAAGRLRGLTPGSVELSTGDVVEVPVVYDGPDLAHVARLTGLPVDEVVAAHTGQEWSVAFGGFAPGFAYLVGGDERLAVPRRESPRTTVPAGSVGLAGEFSGVYPRPSPGGWQLIGRTDLPLWDLDRDPPALLVPGTRVRFVAVRS